MRKGRTPRPLDIGDPIELALLASGEERAADVVALQLLQNGSLFLTSQNRIAVTPSNGEIIASPEFDRLRFSTSKLDRSQFPKIFRTSIASSSERLVDHGLAISFSEMSEIRCTAAFITGFAVLIGIIGLCIDVHNQEQHKKIIAIAAGTVILAFVQIASAAMATPHGKRLLMQFSLQQSRAIRAPLPSEVIMAFALVGPKALRGTSLASYARLIQADENKGDAGGGCGSGCGGGGD